MPSETIEWLQLGDNSLRAAEEVVRAIDEYKVQGLPEDKARFCTPILKPGKIICLAGNYQEHITEVREDVVQKDRTIPYPFLKPTTSLLPHLGNIQIPTITDRLDWEVELVAVIGKHIKEATPEQAEQAIAGYTVLNDISSRRINIVENRRERPMDEFFDFLIGKWQDTCCPLGPYISTPDEAGNIGNLRLTLALNGEIMQDSSTTNMIYSVPEVTSFCSHLFTLEPGDIISTGTPGGTGDAQGIYLKPGDMVEAEVEGLGVLRNNVMGSE